MATLEEVPLKFGQVVQLQLRDQTRLYTKLVGYLVDQVVILTAPAVSDKQNAPVEGDTLVCRVFAGRTAVGFKSHVLKVIAQPLAHLYLAYPKEVESVVVRKSARVTVAREARVIKATDQGEVTETATLSDLSVAGAGAIAKAEFAAVKDAVVLLLPGTEGQPELRLNAVIRSVRAVADSATGSMTQSQYGLQFTDLGTAETEALDKLVQDVLTKDL